MTQEQVEQELRGIFNGYSINRTTFYTEDKFIAEHMEYIVEQCDGTWDDKKAAEAMALLRRSQ